MTITKNVIYIGSYIFRGCNLNGKITIENSGIIKDSAFRDITGEGEIVLNGNNLLGIEQNAFYGNLLIKEVTLPENCKLMGKAAFMWCKNIEKVSLLW